MDSLMPRTGALGLLRPNKAGPEHTGARARASAKNATGATAG